MSLKSKLIFRAMSVAISILAFSSLSESFSRPNNSALPVLANSDNSEDSAHEFRVFTDDEGALITKREGKPYRRGIKNIEIVLPK